MRLFRTDSGRIGLRWMVNGLSALKVPPFAGFGRSDDLWRTTCFELFVSDAAGGGYSEYNFSPSHRWAAYHFVGYRDGMSAIEVSTDPLIVPEAGDELFVQTVWLDGSVFEGTASIGLCAVIEEISGRKSYWALAHGRDEPDFHDPACFALTLG